MITLSEALKLLQLSGEDYVYMFPKGSDIDEDYIWMSVGAIRKRFYMKKTMVHAIHLTNGERIPALEITMKLKGEEKHGR